MTRDKFFNLCIVLAIINVAVFLLYYLYLVLVKDLVTFDAMLDYSLSLIVKTFFLQIMAFAVGYNHLLSSVTRKQFYILYGVSCSGALFTPLLHLNFVEAALTVLADIDVLVFGCAYLLLTNKLALSK